MTRFAVLLALVLFALTPAVANAEIIFDRGTDIYAANDDGSGAHLVAASSWLGMDNGLESPAVSPSGDTLLFTGETLQNKVIGGHANWYGDGTDGVYRLSGGQFQRLSVPPAPAGTSTSGDLVPEPGGSNYAYQAYDCHEVFTGHGYDNICGGGLYFAPLSQGSAGATQFATACGGASDPAIDPASATTLIAYGGCQENFGDPTLDDDQAILVVSGPGRQGETVVAVGADTDKVDHPSAGFRDSSFSPDGQHLVTFNSGGIHDYFDSGLNEHMDPIPGALMVYDDLSQTTAGRTVLQSPSNGSGGYERLYSPRFMGDKIVFVAENAVWTVPANCSNCQFPADATKVYDGAGSAITGVAWTSGHVTPGTAPPPAPPQQSGGGGTTTTQPPHTTTTTTTTTTTHTTTPLTSTALALVSKSAKVKKGVAVIALKCTGTAACAGTLKLSAKVGKKTITLGTARYSLAAGKGGGVKVKLSSAGKKALKKARHHKLTASASATVGGGATATGKVKLAG